MKKTPALRFFKCYAALVGAFDPAEVIFILYMEQMTTLGRLGYSTSHSQQYHMMRMAIGKRLFKKYVEKFTKMKLLIKVAKCDGNIDFGIDTMLYEKLVRTLDSFKSTMLARQFCDEMFGGNSVVSLVDLDAEMLDEWKQKHTLE